jgi:hypothetical protein
MRVINDNINIKDLDMLIRMVLHIKSVEYGVILSESHINLLVDFYKYGISYDTYQHHINLSSGNKNYFKSVATINNAKTYLKKVGIITGDKAGKLDINEDYLPIGLSSDLMINTKIVYDKQD